jgi:hypothetical protein
MQPLLQRSIGCRCKNGCRNRQSSIRRNRQFAKGGKLNGPSLSANGGMPVINPVTGRTEAEVEGGEYILSKNTVRNNRPLADALLYSSMYGNGASIQPRLQDTAIYAGGL